MYGRDAAVPLILADGVRWRRRRQRKTAAMMMEIAAIPLTTPPAITPGFKLPFGDPVADAAAEDVYTPEGPKIAPGPYSGLSI
jgi:hypothetical protein